MTAALAGVACVSQGMWQTSPLPGIDIHSLVVFSMFLLLSHLLKINSRGGQESGVTHPHNAMKGREDKELSLK